MRARLDQTLIPILDYHKAKRLMWDPRDIDLEPDRRAEQLPLHRSRRRSGPAVGDLTRFLRHAALLADAAF